MNKSQQDITFPQTTIRLAVEQAVRSKFQIDWDPHVVRQHRVLKDSKLQFIDYAVPCFELAKLVGIDPSTAAINILDEIRSGNESIQEFQVETISGYVNFQVPIDFLKEALLQTIEWFNSPYLLQEHSHRHDFLVSGPTIGKEKEFALTQRACRYIAELYNFVGVDYSIRNLVCDISEEAAQKLSTDWLAAMAGDQKNSAIEQMRFRRAFEAFLVQKADGAGVDKIESLIEQTHLTFKNGIYATADKNKSEDVFESDIAAAVQVFLDDEANRDRNASLIRDAVSSALYYSKGDSVVALRSARGVLYKCAFIIYLLSEMTKQDNHKALITLIAPSKNELVIKDFMQNSLNQSAIIYFDPRVSQADIQEIAPTFESLKAHFQNIAAVLQNMPENSLSNTVLRQSVLSLVDTPVTANELICKSQIPAIFDLLNQSIQSVATLQH